MYSIVEVTFRESCVPVTLHQAKTLPVSRRDVCLASSCWRISCAPVQTVFFVEQNALNLISNTASVVLALQHLIGPLVHHYISKVIFCFPVLTLLICTPEKVYSESLRMPVKVSLVKLVSHLVSSYD